MTATMALEPRTRIKICGLTREEDVRAAVDAGADAIGLVFYARSPRHVDVAHAAALAELVPPFVSVHRPAWRRATPRLERRKCPSWKPKLPSPGRKSRS